MATHPTALHLGRADAGRLVSSEDFAEASFEEPWKYEREGGRLVVMAPSGEDHNDSGEPWRDRLVTYKLARPDVVQKVISEAWVRDRVSTDRVGDIGIYLTPTGPVPKIPDRVPDLMFEIVSPGKRSRNRVYVKKRRDYEGLGVREYVIIDRFARTVTILTLEPGGYAECILRVGDAYGSPLLPGLAIPLVEVFS